MKLKPGQSLASVTDSTSVVIIRAPDGDLSLTCGGVEMTDPKAAADKQPIVAGATGGSLLGKRYVDGDNTIEVVCTKGGEGALALDGVVLSVRAAKPLPASD